MAGLNMFILVLGAHYFFSACVFVESTFSRKELLACGNVLYMAFRWDESEIYIFGLENEHSRRRL